MNIREVGVNWDDVSELADATCQILLFAEAFNSFCSRRILADPGKSFPTQGLLLEFRKDIADRQSWPEWVELVSFLREAHCLPNINHKLFDFIARLLFQPARIRVGEHKEWELIGTSSLPRTPVPLKITRELWLVEVVKEVGFTTQRPPEVANAGRIRGLFWDQLIDPIAVCHTVLIELNPGKHSVERAEFIFQRSIRRYFDIPFTNEHKYSLSKITTRFNRLFYGTSTPHLRDIQGVRSETVSTGLLIREIQSLLIPLSNSKNDSTRTALKQALGLFLFARFCRVLRPRYFRLALSLQEQHGRFGSLVGEGRQCLSALRRLEYGYFVNRVFGSISEISGLNFIFRGAILPRTQTGRAFVVTGPPGSGKTVFALQKVCGIASRGGLAIYFSFEERLDLLVDRLVAFDLLEGNAFDVVPAGEDIEEKLELARSSGRGLLVLFTLGRSDNFPLLDVIRSVGKSKWRWRALVIDSINALQFRSSDTGELGGPPSDRIVAREIIETIEGSGFLGIIIGEETAGRFEELEYVADTIIQFGLGQGDRSRWLEIRKCRSQNYHAGRHQVRLVEGEGVSIIPSLGAVRSALRRRTKSTLSRERVINGPAGLVSKLEVAEKSSTLIYGYHGMGKTLLLLQLATEATCLETADGIGRGFEEPRAVMVVNFKTTEARFYRVLMAKDTIFRRWQRLRTRKVRWFSPGETITGDEVVWEIWRHIQESRRRGLPIDRIVFDEIENSLVTLPFVAKESLFWTTMLQLIGAEAITAFLGFSLEKSRADVEVLDILRTEVDYVFKVEKLRIARESGTEGEVEGRDNKDFKITVEKRPEEMRNGDGLREVGEQDQENGDDDQ